MIVWGTGSDVRSVANMRSRSRKPVKFFHVDRDLAAVLAAATEQAGPVGIDALDLLTAAIDYGGGIAGLIRRFGSKPTDVKIAADLARAPRQGKPGLSEDAKAVMEAVSQTSLARRQNSSSADLMEALLTVDSPARAVLRTCGIDEAAVGSLRGGFRIAFGLRFALERLLRLKPDPPVFRQPLDDDIDDDYGRSGIPRPTVDAERYFAIVFSPLVRVVSVAQVVEAGGIAVELLAIEVREAGALLYWRAHPPEGIVLMSATVSISDESGTMYRVSPAQSSGSALQWEGQTFVIPAPSAHARLGIVLERFGAPIGRPIERHAPGESARGPWRFDVDPQTE